MSLLLTAIGICVTVPAADAAGAVTRGNWDLAQQRRVVRAGAMHPIGRAFHVPLRGSWLGSAFAWGRRVSG